MPLLSSSALRSEVDELLHHVGQERQSDQCTSDQHRPLDQNDVAGDRGNVADDRIERAAQRCIKRKFPRPEQHQEEEAAGGGVVPRQVLEVVEPEDRRRHDAEPDESGRPEPGEQAEQDARAADQLQKHGGIDQPAGQMMRHDQRRDDRRVGELARPKQQEIGGEANTAD